MRKAENWVPKLINWDSIGSRRVAALELRIALSDDTLDQVNLIEEMVGESVSQGDLFAYLFRRFGFPNVSSDAPYSLASYLLSTPCPDMALQVTPHASGIPTLSFRFMVPSKVSIEIDEWPYRERRAYEERLQKWLSDDAQRPSWADEWVKDCGTEKHPLTMGLGGNDFFSCVFYLNLISDRKDERIKWLDTMIAAYGEVEPEPGPEYRTADWKSWPDEDPLKAYVAAVETTLRDLHRPVGIRDLEISIHGVTDTISSKDAAPRSDVAGTASGNAINADCDSFEKLHRVMLQLGDGDLAAGVKAVLAKFDTDTPEEGDDA